MLPSPLDSHPLHLRVQWWSHFAFPHLNCSCLNFNLKLAAIQIGCCCFDEAWLYCISCTVPNKKDAEKWFQDGMLSNFSIFLGMFANPKKNGSRVGGSGTIEQILLKHWSLGIRRSVPFHDRKKSTQKNAVVSLGISRAEKASTSSEKRQCICWEILPCSIQT